MLKHVCHPRSEGFGARCTGFLSDLCKGKTGPQESLLNSEVWNREFRSLEFEIPKFRVAQEPNRKPEPSEPFFLKPKAEPEPPEPFSRNRNRNRNRPFLLHCTENTEESFLQRNRQNRKPEPLEPFHPQTVTEPNRGLPGNYGFRKLHRTVGRK